MPTSATTTATAEPIGIAAAAVAAAAVAVIATATAIAVADYFKNYCFSFTWHFQIDHIVTAVTAVVVAINTN